MLIKKYQIQVVYWLQLFWMQKLLKLRITYLHNSKYISSEEFSKLTVENVKARLKEDDLVNKTDFDNKLTSFNWRITSNKTKHSEVQKELNDLITKDYNFFLGKTYSTSIYGSQNTFVYQPAVDALELKKD